MKNQRFVNQAKALLGNRGFVAAIVAVAVFMGLYVAIFGRENAPMVMLLVAAALVVALLVWLLPPMPARAPRPKRQRKTKPQRPVTDEQYNAHRRQDQRRVDAILDKISKSGYDSLSKEEKAFLFNYK